MNLRSFYSRKKKKKKKRANTTNGLTRQFTSVGRFGCRRIPLHYGDCGHFYPRKRGSSLRDLRPYHGGSAAYECIFSQNVSARTIASKTLYERPLEINRGQQLNVSTPVTKAEEMRGSDKGQAARTIARNLGVYPHADRKRGDPPAYDTTVVANKISGPLFMVTTETREHGGFLPRRYVRTIVYRSRR